MPVREMRGGLGGREPGRVGTHTRRGLWLSAAGQEVGSLSENWQGHVTKLLLEKKQGWGAVVPESPRGTEPEAWLWQQEQSCTQDTS